jgi:hypothetical protein
MKNQMESFSKDLFSALEAVDKESQVDLLKAVIEYLFDGIEPNLSGVNKAIWILIKDYINESREKLIENKVPQKVERKVFRKPSVQEICTYIVSTNSNADPARIKEFAEQFYNFYESKDWMIGKSRMKNWVAALRTWKETMQKVLYPKMISHNQPSKGSWEYRQMEYIKGVQSIMNDESI